MVQFDWDSNKNQINQIKHGISFEEASSAFFDDFARITYDPDHSHDEDRFILLGMSSLLKLLVVCHCYRDHDNIIRIFSARKANNRETKQYGDFL